MYLRLRTKTDIDFATNHVYRHSFSTRPVENGVDYKSIIFFDGAHRCQLSPATIRHNRIRFSKAEALSSFGHNSRGAAQRVDTVLLLYHNTRKRFTSCYCNRLCYQGSAFSESGTAAGKSAFPAAASANLTPFCSGMPKGSTANFKYNKSMEQMCKLNLKIQ